MTEETGFSLDTSLDDIDDLPSFTCFPTGSYTLNQLKWEEKDINGKKTFVSVSHKMVQVHELHDLEEGEVQPKEGDLQDSLFDYSNSFGAGALKKYLAPLKAKFGTNSLRETLTAANGANLLVIQKRIYGKTDGKIDKDKKYPQIKEVAVL